eukprot:3136522-Prymnesium_polylepis.2
MEPRACAPSVTVAQHAYSISPSAMYQYYPIESNPKANPYHFEQLKWDFDRTYTVAPTVAFRTAPLIRTSTAPTDDELAATRTRAREALQQFEAWPVGSTLLACPLYALHSPVQPVHANYPHRAPLTPRQPGPPPCHQPRTPLNTTTQPTRPIAAHTSARHLLTSAGRPTTEVNANDIEQQLYGQSQLKVPVSRHGPRAWHSIIDSLRQTMPYPELLDIQKRLGKTFYPGLHFPVAVASLPLPWPRTTSVSPH